MWLVGGAFNFDFPLGGHVKIVDCSHIGAASILFVFFLQNITGLCGTKAHRPPSISLYPFSKLLVFSTQDMEELFFYFTFIYLDYILYLYIN